MVKKESRTFQMHVNDVDPLFEELSKWDIEPEECDGGFKFFIQTNNECYEIEILVQEKFTVEEQLSMLTMFPFIKDFADIQNRIFGKVIWNWK